jgi:hypothetical protein
LSDAGLDVNKYLFHRSDDGATCAGLRRDHSPPHRALFVRRNENPLMGCEVVCCQRDKTALSEERDYATCSFFLLPRSNLISQPLFLNPAHDFLHHSQIYL